MMRHAAGRGVQGVGQGEEEGQGTSNPHDKHAASRGGQGIGHEEEEGRGARHTPGTQQEQECLAPGV